MRRKRDVYIAIMVASDQGKRLCLTPEELDDLSLDDAIASRASNALTQEEHQATNAIGTWENIDPYAEREAWNGNVRDPSGRLPDDFPSSEGSPQ